MFNKCRLIIGISICLLIYFLINYVFYFKFDKNIQNPKDLTENDSKIHHFFVIKTFVYRNSKSFDGKNAVVMLFKTENSTFNDNTFVCQRVVDNASNSSGGITEKVTGRIQQVHRILKLCKISLFRLVCLFPDEIPNNFETVQLAKKNPVTKMFSSIELQVSEPDKKPRSFVSCMSRMVAFDDWKLVVYHLETFRFYGGDLVVAYVNCALEEIFDLLKIYEKDGILMVKHGYEGYQPEKLSYHPDVESEYATQLTTLHECLYEFKESAEFIAMIDWDDILIGPRIGNQFGKYSTGFQQLAQTFPKAAAFYVSRVEAVFQPKFEPIKTFNLEKFTNSLQVYNNSQAGKVILKPEKTIGAWVHFFDFGEESDFIQIPVENDVAILAHLRNVTKIMKPANESLPEDDIMDLGTLINGTTIQSSLESFIKKHRLESTFESLPETSAFYDLMNDCYLSIVRDWKFDNVTYCPNHLKCKYPKQKLKVVKISTKYQKPMILDNFIFYQRENVEFVKSNNGCL